MRVLVPWISNRFSSAPSYVGADNPRAEACVREIADTAREIGDRIGADRVDRTLRAWEARR